MPAVNSQMLKVALNQPEDPGSREQTNSPPQPLNAPLRPAPEWHVEDDTTGTVHGAAAGEESLPLSFSQERLWLMDQLHPGSPLYNVPCAFRILAPLNVKALELSLQQIVRRHEVLRTVYALNGDTPLQRILPQWSLSLPLIDLSALPASEREAELQRCLDREARRPFDLSSDLMLRACLFRLTEQDHVCFLNVHHIAFDEWSMGVLFRELALLYSAHCENREAVLPELPVQYADFALWQRDSTRSEALKQQMNYWRAALSGSMSLLELPTDKPKLMTPSHGGAQVQVALGSELTTRIKEFCRTENVTLFMLLLGGFNALLHRYTGEEDIVVGMPIAGRNRMEIENLIGFFVNSLPLRASVAGAPSFRELLRRVREACLGAFSNQDVPFEKLVQELHPNRSAASNPLFNVMFALQNAPEEVRLGDLNITPLHVHSGTAKFDLTLVLMDGPDGLTALLEYDLDLFGAETASRILRHYRALIESAIADPAAPVGTLQMLTAEEHQQVSAWNLTRTEYPQQTVDRLFETQASTASEAFAVRYGDAKISYRELSVRSSQLAHHLRKQGVGPCSLVAVCLERSIDMIVAWLGVLKAGAAYVPLDRSYPAERLEFMLKDTAAPLVLTQRSLLDRLPDGTRTICLDTDWKQIARESKTPPPSIGSPDSVAYVIYTSGSTGQPKGVAIPHRGIVRLLFNPDYIQLDSSQRIAQASNSSFDAATFEVWGALLHGGTLIGIDRDVLLSPSDLQSQIRQHRITSIFITTALFNQVAAEAPQAFATVGTVLFGGEACDPKSVRAILEQGAPKRLLHVYGPTETTTFATWHQVKSVPEGAATLPIGKPISNTTAFVLDRNLQPLPVGVPGELYIGGDGLARGYHQRPELTSAKFVTSPLVGGERLYRTGDLVRRLPDGSIEFIGRVDNQVKIRGFRIELEEIEKALERHPSVRNAVVEAKDRAGGKWLVAYVVPHQRGACSPAELHEFLVQKLPQFMVPGAFVELESLPINANGKIDRRALPEAPEGGLAGNEEQLPPRNNLEHQLHKIWQEILGVKALGVRNNFFELGGHSLLAVRLFARIEKKLGLKLPISTLFQAPTIEQLACVISRSEWRSPGASLFEIQPGGTRPPIFWLHTLGGGGGGGLFTYRKLASLLGPDQPSYGLVTPPEPFRRIEDMAAHYVEEMRTVDPVGPYHLGGYCFGGVVAFEMARQLEARGFKVALLALIESIPPNLDREELDAAAFWRFFGQLPLWTWHSVRQGPSELLAPIRSKSSRMRKAIRAWVNGPTPEVQAEVIDEINEVIDFTHYPEDFKRYARSHWEALQRYRPGAYNGVVTLFRTCKPRLLSTEPEVLWGRLAASVEVRRIPGSHEKILEEPSVVVLARNVAECLARMQHDKASAGAA